MEKRKRKVRPQLKDLIPDEERRKEIISRQYKGNPIEREDGIFTDLLQAMVNAFLEGEMDYHVSLLI